jgi:hypothetical protein
MSGTKNRARGPSDEDKLVFIFINPIASVLVVVYINDAPSGLLSQVTTCRLQLWTESLTHTSIRADVPYL